MNQSDPPSQQSLVDKTVENNTQTVPEVEPQERAQIIKFTRAPRSSYTPLQIHTRHRRRLQWIYAWGLGAVIAYTASWYLPEYRICYSWFRESDRFLVLDTKKEVDKSKSLSPM